MIFFKRLGLVRTVLVALSAINIQTSYSQQEKKPAINRLEIGVGYNHILDPWQGHNIYLQADYKLNRFLAPSLSYIHSVEFNAFEYADKYHFVGLGCKIHIVPLFLEESHYFRIDYYIKPSVEFLYDNGYTMDLENNWVESDHSYTYVALGTGLVLYPWKRLGLSADCTWFLLNEHLFTRLSFGLNVRF